MLFAFDVDGTLHTEDMDVTYRGPITEEMLAGLEDGNVIVTVSPSPYAPKKYDRISPYGSNEYRWANVDAAMKAYGCSRYDVIYVDDLEANRKQITKNGIRALSPRDFIGEFVTDRKIDATKSRIELNAGNPGGRHAGHVGGNVKDAGTKNGTLAENVDKLILDGTGDERRLDELRGRIARDRKIYRSDRKYVAGFFKKDSKPEKKTPEHGHRDIRYAESSGWWYLLPVFLWCLGGIIAWAFTRNDDPSRAKKTLILGFVLSIPMFMVVIFALIGISYPVDQLYAAPEHIGYEFSEEIQGTLTSVRYGGGHI